MRRDSFEVFEGKGVRIEVKVEDVFAFSICDYLGLALLKIYSTVSQIDNE